MDTPTLSGVEREETRILLDDVAARRTLEQLVLLCASLDREQAASLLEGLAGPQRAHARRLHVELKALPSALRHGRIATAFVRPPVSLFALQTRFSDAGSALGAVLHDLLPEQEREGLEVGTKHAAEERAPLTRRLAARLVEESRWHSGG